MSGRFGSKMTTGFERFFKPMTFQGQFLIYQEMLHQYIHFLDDEGNVLSSKLDKIIPGKYYKEANDGERTLDGVISYTFPNGDTKVLVGLRQDVDGRPLL